MHGQTDVVVVVVVVVVAWARRTSKMDKVGEDEGDAEEAFGTAVATAGDVVVAAAVVDIVVGLARM